MGAASSTCNDVKCICRLEGHTDAVVACCLSPDGAVVVSGSLDNTLRLWDADSGKLVRKLEGHTAAVWACDFSPDGRLVLSSSKDCSLRLWDASTGTVVRTLHGHTGVTWACCFSPDGGFILSGSADTTLRLWDVQDLRNEDVSSWCDRADTPFRIFQGHTKTVIACAISPDSQFILSGSSDGTFRMWEASGGEFLRLLEGHTDTVVACTFSPDSKLLLSGSRDFTLRLWSAETGELIRKFEGHTKPVWDCRFSPDGDLLLSGSWDNTVRLWDTGTGGLVRCLQGHTDAVMACRFSPDGRFVVSGSNDKTLLKWQLPEELAAVSDGRFTLATLRERYAGHPWFSSGSAVERAVSSLELLVGVEAAKATAAVLINAVLSSGPEGVQMTYPNLVLEGPPGTGKSTVASALASVFAAVGMLRSDRLVPVSKDDLCGEAIGTTTKRCRTFLERNAGCVLLYDEADNFCTSDKDYAKEAAKELNKFLADQEQTPLGDKTVFIVAGYAEGLKDHFFSADKGLASRFPKSNRLKFVEFTPSELATICRQQAEKKGYFLGGDDSDNSRAHAPSLEAFFNDPKRSAAFKEGNARTMTTFLDTAINTVYKIQTDRCEGKLRMSDLIAAYAVHFEEAPPCDRSRGRRLWSPKSSNCHQSVIFLPEAPPCDRSRGRRVWSPSLSPCPTPTRSPRLSLRLRTNVDVSLHSGHFRSRLVAEDMKGLVSSSSSETSPRGAARATEHQLLEQRGSREIDIAQYRQLRKSLVSVLPGEAEQLRQHLEEQHEQERTELGVERQESLQSLEEMRGTLQAELAAEKEQVVAEQQRAVQAMALLEEARQQLHAEAIEKQQSQSTRVELEAEKQRLEQLYRATQTHLAESQAQVASLQSQVAVVLRVFLAVLVVPVLAIVVGACLTYAVSLMNVYALCVVLAAALTAAAALLYQLGWEMVRAIWKWLRSKFGLPFLAGLSAIFALYTYCEAARTVLLFKLGADWITVGYTIYALTAEMRKQFAATFKGALLRLSSTIASKIEEYSGTGGRIRLDSQASNAGCELAPFITAASSQEGDKFCIIGRAADAVEDASAKDEESGRSADAGEELVMAPLSSTKSQRRMSASNTTPTGGQRGKIPGGGMDRWRPRRGSPTKRDKATSKIKYMRALTTSSGEESVHGDESDSAAQDIC